MSDTYDNPTLRPEMQEFLDIEGRGRLGQCWNRVWVPTPSTKDAFVALQDCMNAAPSTKPRGLIITGDADTGKSRTMTAFRKLRDRLLSFPATVADRTASAPDVTAVRNLLTTEMRRMLDQLASELDHLEDDADDDDDAGEPGGD